MNTHSNRIRLGVATIAIAVAFVVASAVTEAACASQQESGGGGDSANFQIPARSIEESLKSFAVADGLEVQLVAAEPNVLEPVAISYDEQGRLYVAEFLKFPTVNGNTDRPNGRIRVLTDPNNDGVYDQATVFADEIGWPTGICPWDGGLFVIAAPNLWYLKDTDGDLKADVREIRWTGFGFSNEEGTANNLIFGIDHWIYGAGSNSGGRIVRPDVADSKPVDLRGADFRFHPVTGQFEAISGSEQFGNSFNDGYQRFICQNSKPVVHVVMPARYLERNPYLATTSIKQDAWQGDRVFRISPPEPWRIARSNIRQSMPRNWAAPFVRHDVFTATSGATIYRGSAFGLDQTGNLFVGDVQSNLIHRRSMVPDGASFGSTRIDQETEVLRSSDNWFRPVNLYNAPDGCLHIVDMYRELIETPDSLPEEILAQVDLNRGNDRGRIYRLAPTGFNRYPNPRLNQASIEQLVDHLTHADSWWRETAQRLIYQRQDPAAIKPLRELLQESFSHLGRMHALYSLAGLDALTAADVIAAMNDPSPWVREHAVRLSERWLRQANAPEADRTLKSVVQLADDRDARVRFQVACSLGEVQGVAKSQLVANALQTILLNAPKDHWTQTAVLSSSLPHANYLLKAMLKSGDTQSLAGLDSVCRQLALFAGATADRESLSELIAALEQQPDNLQRLLMLGLASGLQRTGHSLREHAKSFNSLKALLRQQLAQATQTLANDSADESQRIAAIEMLTHATFEQAQPLLADALEPRWSPQVQFAAVRTLATFESSAPTLLIASWHRLSPTIRTEAMEFFLSRPASTKALLQAISDGKIKTAELDPGWQRRLLDTTDSSIRKLAEQVLRDVQLSARHSVVESYQPVLELVGVADRGREIFQQQCATCHRLNGLGVDVGPDLATVRNQTSQQLLVQILAPNREIQANYQNYLLLLDDGRQATGRLVSETPTSLTLQRSGNVRQTVLRDSIEQIKATGTSLMPEGLEQKIDHQQMADLLAFLRQAD